MLRKTTIVAIALALLAGFGIGNLVAAKKAKPEITPSVWEGKSPEQAASAMLEIGVALAGSGSWESIHVGRVYYLSGDTQKAEEIFKRYQGDKALPSDLVRIARVYAQAGEWDKAGPLYDRVIKAKSKDADWLIEAGSYYNLNGQRERAEQLFEQGFALGSKSLRDTLIAAGSYVDVEPRQR